MLITFSGKKGYHIDVFLNKMLDSSVIKNFYHVLLDDIGATTKEVELRGASRDGYKLPLGYHQGTNNYCAVVDENGMAIADYMDTVRAITPLQSEVIGTIININYNFDINEDQVIEVEEILDQVQGLKTYENTIAERIEKILGIIEKGVQEQGNRNNTVFEVGLYLRFKGLCLAEAKEFMTNWIDTKWGTNAKTNELMEESLDTITNIYKKGYKLSGAKEITISKPDINEIFTVTSKNKLQAKALRKLYFILLIHSRVYSDENGEFFMTYLQLEEAGAVTQRSFLKAQLKELEKRGKLLFIRENHYTEGKLKKDPNIYKLLAFNDIKVDFGVKTFKKCSGSNCVGCLDRAICYLLPTRERTQHIKGKEYKDLGVCPHNKS